MPGIFVSYTSSDQAWAFWIAREIDGLGYKAFVHEWEIRAGEDILAWMEKRFDEADHALLVISPSYLTKEKVYSSWERRSAQWAAAKEPGFALPVYVEKCEAPQLLQNFKRCDLFDLDEDAARVALAACLTPAGPPSGPVRFPGRGKLNEASTAPFPGKHAATPAIEQTKLTPAPAPTPPEAVASPAPAPPALSSLPPNPKMIGREDRLEELVKAILDEERPIVVPGGLGMGKTTLALAAAHDSRVIARFGKARRFFVNLEPAPNAEGALTRLATDLGLPASGAPSEVEAKIAAACAGQPTLAILDNLETPWDKDTAATEALLGRLAAIDGLRLVITVRGEPPKLPGAGARTLRNVEQLQDADARALFLRHAGDHFAADPALPGLVSALDGHPLSIELLAANAQGKLDLRGLAADWNDRRTDLLRHVAGNDRLTSLRASLDLSLAALDPPSSPHRLIRLMALLPDGMSDADSRTILNDGAPTREERGAAARLETARLANRPDGRWRLLAPIRETLLADFPPEAEDRARLVSTFLRRAALGDYAGTDKWSDVRDELTAEAGNLDAMIGVAATESELPEGLWPAVIGLRELHRFTGLASYASLPGVAKRFRDIGDLQGEANCIKGLGDIAFARSDHESARQRYEAALALYRKVGSVLGEANCIKSLGDIALRRSDHEAARQRYEAALPLYRKVGSVLGEANCIWSLGDIALRRSDHEAARQRYEEALPLFRKVGDLQGEANCIRSLGDIALARSDHEPRASATRRRCPSTGRSATCKARPIASGASATSPFAAPITTARASATRRRCRSIGRSATCSARPIASRASATSPLSAPITKPRASATRRRYRSSGRSATYKARPIASGASATSPFAAPITMARASATRRRCRSSGRSATCSARRFASRD